MLCLACTSAANNCWALTPSERAAAANAGDDVSAPPAANSGRNAALTRAVLRCSSLATAAAIALWPCRSCADLEPTGFLDAPGLCVAGVLPAMLCLACTSAANNCWALTPSERAAATNAGDDVSAPPAANSGRNAAFTRAVLRCSSLATAAAIALWPCRSCADLEPTALDLPGFTAGPLRISPEDMVFAGLPGLEPAADAAAMPPPVARAAVTAAAAAIILVRSRMRILLRLVACNPGNQAVLRPAEENPCRGLRKQRRTEPLGTLASG